MADKRILIVLQESCWKIVNFKTRKDQKRIQKIAENNNIRISSNGIVMHGDINPLIFALQDNRYDVLNF